MLVDNKKYIREKDKILNTINVTEYPKKDTKKGDKLAPNPYIYNKYKKIYNLILKISKVKQQLILNMIVKLKNYLPKKQCNAYIQGSTFLP